MTDTTRNTSVQPNNDNYTLSRFKTKKALIAHFSGILNAATIGETLRAHFIDLVELLSRHPDAALKIGSGAASFHVGAVATKMLCLRSHGQDRDDFLVSCLH